MWCDGGPMPHQKAELEVEFFTGNDFPGNICGFNPNPEKVHPTILREKKRRPTSNALDKEGKESLEVAAGRVSELLTKEQSHTELVLKSFVKMNIKSNHDLHIVLNNTRNSPQLVETFMDHFKEMSGSLQLSHKEGSFFKCASMYMDGRWNYNHEYFQRMIDRHGRMNAEVIDCIIIDMAKLIKDDSSSDGGSMPSLQDGGQSDWSSNNDTDSYGDDDMYYKGNGGDIRN